MDGPGSETPAEETGEERHPTQSLCVLGFGGNLGDPAARFAEALRRLEGRVGSVEAVSSIVQTPPWDGTEQPDYLNIVALLRTTREAGDVLAFARGLEREAGRPERHPRWGARSLDIDIILWFAGRVAGESGAGAGATPLSWRGVVIDEPGLTVPHPRWRDRAFVVWPLAEIAPSLVDPVSGESAASLRDRLIAAGVAPPAAVGAQEWRAR
jgi:2-amino-4-hydroxy-6-hydroxymethyldihydropteridine diphosphokinase